LSLQPPPLSLQPPTLSLKLLTLSFQPSTLSFQPPPLSLQPLTLSLQHLQKHTKQPNLTEKCLNLDVIVQASSRALRPPFWSSRLSLSSRDLTGRSSTSWSHLETPQKHRKRPDLIGKCLNQKVVIRASPRVLRPPFWSSGLPLTSRDFLGHLLEPPGDAPEAQKSTRLDKNHKNVEFQKNTSEQQFLASGPRSTPPKLKKSVLILFAKYSKCFRIIAHRITGASGQFELTHSVTQWLP
jgi:hypothetical protein